MKKEYIKPTMEIIPIGAVTILAGSGPGPGDQNDPSLLPEELPDFGTPFPDFFDF